MPPSQLRLVPRINLGGGEGRREDWGTPAWLFEKLDAEFHFTLDVCANEENRKCGRFLSRTDDGLLTPWTGEVCWMNPPYGQKQMPQWVRKAHLEAKLGSTVVCLVPSRTDASWWHDYVMDCAEVRFIRSRVNFDNGKRKAPFASAIVIFRPRHRWASLGPPILSPRRRKAP